MPRGSRSGQSSDTPDDIRTAAGGAVPALARYRRGDEDEEAEQEDVETEEDLEDEEWEEEEEEEEYEEEDLDELDF